jgi:hypothetical protein
VADDVGAVCEWAEEPDVQVVAALLGGEGAGGGDFAVPGLGGAGEVGGDFTWVRARWLLEGSRGHCGRGVGVLY